MRGSNPETLDPTQGTTMPHNPVKSIKIDFHTADGVTPKPVPPPAPTKEPAGGAMKQQAAPKPQTQLSPLEEALFTHWATANGIDSSVHGAPDNHYDFRGMYRQTGGMIHPPGALLNAANTFNKIQQNQPEPIRQLLDMIHGGQ